VVAGVNADSHCRTVIESDEGVVRVGDRDAVLEDRLDVGIGVDRLLRRLVVVGQAEDAGANA